MLGNNKAFGRGVGSTGSSSSSSPPNTVSLLAGETIGYPRVLMLSGVSALLFDPLSVNAKATLGLSVASAVLGSQVSIITEGKLVYTGWGLVPAKLYYAVGLGLISLTPPSTGIIQPLGFALDSNTLLINRQLQVQI